MVLYDPAKWLKLSGELNFFTSSQQGRYQEQSFVFAGQSLTGRLSASSGSRRSSAPRPATTWWARKTTPKAAPAPFSISIRA